MFLGLWASSFALNVKVSVTLTDPLWARSKPPGVIGTSILPLGMFSVRCTRFSPLLIETVTWSANSRIWLYLPAGRLAPLIIVETLADCVKSIIVSGTLSVVQPSLPVLLAACISTMVNRITTFVMAPVVVFLGPLPWPWLAGSRPVLANCRLTLPSPWDWARLDCGLVSWLLMAKNAPSVATSTRTKGTTIFFDIFPIDISTKVFSYGRFFGATR